MLSLVGIEKIRPRRYLVSFDRDGQILQYVFGAPGPEVPEEMAIVHGMLKAMEDLVDYVPEYVPGKPYGALHVPAVWEAGKLVRKFARGHKVELPVVLDER